MNGKKIDMDMVIVIERDNDECLVSDERSKEHA